MELLEFSHLNNSLFDKHYNKIAKYHKFNRLHISVLKSVMELKKKYNNIACNTAS